MCLSSFYRETLRIVKNVHFLNPVNSKIFYKWNPIYIGISHVQSLNIPSRSRKKLIMPKKIVIYSFKLGISIPICSKLHRITIILVDTVCYGLYIFEEFVALFRIVWFQDRAPDFQHFLRLQNFFEFKLQNKNFLRKIWFFCDVNKHICWFIISLSTSENIAGVIQVNKIIEKFIFFVFSSTNKDI